MGFGEKVVIAHFFGTGDTADVYFASMGVVLSVVWLVRELVYPSLLPVFAGSLSKSPDVSDSLFRKVFLCAVVFLGVAGLGLAVFGRFAAAVFMPGFSAPKRALASGLLRALSPAVVFFGLMMVTYTVLNARRDFSKAAWPDAILKLFVVLGLIALAPVMGIYAVAAVLGAGTLGCLILQLHFIPGRRALWQNNSCLSDGGEFEKVLILMGPLVVGAVFSHISGLVDNSLASMLPRGQLSYLGYSKKLIDAILLIGPVALVTVVYSQLSHLASSGEHKQFRTLVAKASRLVLYLSVPTGCVLACLRGPVVRFLFERGRFDGQSTAGTAAVFVVYAAGLVTLSLETLLVYSFFALGDTRTPVKWGIICVVFNIMLAVVMMRWFAGAGIAAAFVISKTVKVCVLAVTLHRRLGGLFDQGLAVFAAKLAASTALVWIVVGVLGRIGHAGGFVHRVAFDLMLPGMAAAAVFGLCSYVLRIEELGLLLSVVRNRKAAASRLAGESK